MIVNTVEDLVTVNSNNPTNKKSLEESDEKDCIYYICGICGYEIKTEEERKVHMNTNHKDYSECLICYKMVSPK